MKTYRVTVTCEQDGAVVLDEKAVPEPLAKLLLAEAPKLKAAAVAGRVLAAPGKLASLLARKPG